MANDTVVSNEENGVGAYMLTTVDNPFSPFTQWVEWYAYDVASGHHTCALLARIVVTSDELSYVDQVVAIQEAVDEIAKENVSGLHRKILKER